jgi:hypothetical protein
MSARKWPFYFLKKGEQALIPDKTWLQQRVHQYGYRTGKIFRTRRCDEGRKVTRLA